MGNIIGITVLLLSILVMGGTARLSMPYFENEFPGILISFAGSLSVIIVSIIFLYRKHFLNKWISMKWGLFIGASLFLFLQVLIITTQYQQILTDGTAYWIYLQLPPIYIAAPLFLVGAIIGLIADLIRRKKSNKGPEFTGAPPSADSPETHP